LLPDFSVKFGVMTLEIFILLALCFVPTLGIHCEDDISLDNVMQYTKEVEKIGDLDYWRTAQNNFQVYGIFDGNPSSSIVQAGYYTEDDKLIHGITVDCGKGKWSSQVTNDADNIENWLTGDLAAPCEDGASFDVWFKVHQPKMMSWIFNGQPLQYKTRQTQFTHGQTPSYRTRTLEVPTKHGSNHGKFFKVKVTGAAKLTRLTWGQCISWPLSMRENCQAARKWVQLRSKMETDVKPYGGLGHFGSDEQTFSPTCFLGSRYYDWLQESVHPDRNSKGYPYCCCVDMITGLVNKSDDHACENGALDGTCDKSCIETARIDLIEEIMREQDLMGDNLAL